jgi:hypothetical protein
MVLTGKVEARPSGMWVEGEEPPPPEIEVLLQILDVAASHEALAVALIYSAETEATFADAVPLMLQDVADGLVGEDVDIRTAAAKPPRKGRTPVEEAEGLEGLSEELGEVEGQHGGGDLTTAPRRVSRERLTLEELEARETDKPWEPLGLTSRQYFTWWNSGWDYPSWSRRLDGRRGQFLFRLLGGAGLGPTVGRYYGRVSYYGAAAVQEEIYATHEVVSGWGSELGLAVAWGLIPSLEVEAGVSREGGHYATDIRMVFHGDEQTTSEQTRQQDYVKNGTPQAWLGARWVPWPERTLRPAAGLGLALWWGHAAQAGDLNVSLFPTFSAPRIFSLRLAPGGELRLARQADLVLQVPVHVLLAGTSPTTWDEIVLEGSPGLPDKREPERAFPLAFGLQAGVQVRLGGRHKDRAVRVEDDLEVE